MAKRSSHVHVLSNIDDVEESPVSAPPLARSARTASTDNSPEAEAAGSALAGPDNRTTDYDSGVLGFQTADQDTNNAVDGYESDDERPSKRHRPHED